VADADWAFTTRLRDERATRLAAVRDLKERLATSPASYSACGGSCSSTASRPDHADATDIFATSLPAET